MIKAEALPFPEIANGFFRALDNAMMCVDATPMEDSISQ